MTGVQTCALPISPAKVAPVPEPTPEPGASPFDFAPTKVENAPAPATFDPALAFGAATALAATGAATAFVANVAAATVPAEEPTAVPTPPVDAAAGGMETGKDRRGMTDDVDHDLLPIFLEEAKEIIPQVGDSLRKWRGTPTNHAPVTELARHLHKIGRAHV